MKDALSCAHKVLLGLFIVSFIIPGCKKDSQPLGISSGDSSAIQTSAPASTDWYSVFFSNPADSPIEYFSDDPNEALVQAIARARLSVDVAIYDLDLYSISTALIQAHRRGVRVRVVTESDNLDSIYSKITALKDVGIPVIGDRRASLMHNKFTVIDRLEVWSGSMNYTSNDLFRNDNNLIRIRSAQIADNYLVEFNEMFEDDLFGSAGRFDTPHPKVNVKGTAIEIHFSPDDGVLSQIIDQVNHAQSSIYFLAYAFTADALSDAMIARFEKGISVSGVFEKSQVISNQVESEFDKMRSAGLDVWVDANPKNMHDKVILIDKKIVITGSYNFSNAAETRNDENSIILYNEDIAELYFNNYQRIYELAKK